jgi:membrane protein YdbS with pleckstrin-like domain
MSLLLIPVAIAIALVLYLLAPDTVEYWLDRIIQSKLVLLRLFGILSALVFIASGNPLLMLVGTAVLVEAVLVVLFKVDTRSLIDDALEVIGL